MTVRRLAEARGIRPARASTTPSGSRCCEATGDDLDALTATADDVRRYTVGEAVSLVVNRNLTSSGSARRPPASPATFTLDDVGAIAADAWDLGATELCVQGLLPAIRRPARATSTSPARSKAAAPGMHLHAYRPQDVWDLADRGGLGLDGALAALREAGVDTVPGTGVKVLSERVRALVAPGDLEIDRWVEGDHRRAPRRVPLDVGALLRPRRDRGRAHRPPAAAPRASRTTTRGLHRVRADPAARARRRRAARRRPQRARRAPRDGRRVAPAAQRQHPAHPDPVDARRPRRRRRPAAVRRRRPRRHPARRTRAARGRHRARPRTAGDGCRGASPRGCSGRSASAPPTTASRPPTAEAADADDAASRSPSSAPASPGSAWRWRCAARAATTSSCSSGRHPSAAPGATTPTPASRATCPRTCTASPTTRTRTGRAPTRAATRSARYLERIVDDASTSATGCGSAPRCWRPSGMPRPSVWRIETVRRGRARRRRRARARVRAADRAVDPRHPGPRDLPGPAVPLGALGSRRRPRRRPRRRRRHRRERRAARARARPHCGARHALPAHARRGSCRAAAAPYSDAERAPVRRAPRRARAACAPRCTPRARRASPRDPGMPRHRRGRAGHRARPPRRRRSPTPRCAPRSPPTTRSAASGCCSRTTSTPPSPSAAVTLEASALAAVEGSTLVGRERRARIEVDALVLATGLRLDAAAVRRARPRRGRRTLAEHWSAGMTSFALDGRSRASRTCSCSTARTRRSATPRPCS